MKKRYLGPLLAALLLTTAPSSIVHATPAHPQKPEPAYAKWSRLAIAKTKERYPNAKLIDYKHVGRTSQSPTVAQETFKIILKQGTREWGVVVRIGFNKTTEQVTGIDFTETRP